MRKEVYVLCNTEAPTNTVNIQPDYGPHCQLSELLDIKQ